MKLYPLSYEYRSKLMGKIRRVNKRITKEIFIKEVDRLWDELRRRDDTIFENIEIQVNSEEKFDAIKEKDPQFHVELINENSVYEKKKMIRQYFWDRIVGDLYEVLPKLTAAVKEKMG